MSLMQRSKIGRFVSTNKLPQFFKKKSEEEVKVKKTNEQMRTEYMKIKAEMGLANEPDELVEGLSDFLRDVGFNSSFLDEEFKLRGEQVPLW